MRHSQRKKQRKQRRKKKSSDAPFSSTLLQYLQCSDIDETETLKDLSDRQLVCAKIVHFIIWSLDLMVYGGFVRDAVIRSEPCNDIDVRVDSVDNNVQSAESVAERIAVFATTYLELKQTMQLTQKGKAKTIKFNSDGWDKPLQIDLVEQKVAEQAPYVDCDVGNLCIRPGGHLGLRVETSAQNKSPLISLEKSIERCQSKKFELYYDPKTREGAYRLKRYKQKGWKAIRKSQDWWLL